MNKLIFFLLTVLTLFSCTDGRNSLDDYNLKGNVVKVYQNRYDAESKFGNWKAGEKSYYGHHIFFFDESGNLTEYHELGRDNSIDMRHVQRFEDGVLVESISYDEDGEIVEKSLHKSNNGKVIETEEFDKDGKLKRTIVYKYDGDLISSGEVHKEGKLDMRWENDFNGDKLKSQTYYDSTGNISSRTVYEINNNKDITKYTTYDAENKVDYEVEWSYEYDSKGNWIKQIEKSDGDVEYVTIRRILYQEDLNKKLSKQDFVGIWFEVDGNDWIELKEDETYDWGYREKIEDYGKWEMDEAKTMITFRSNSPDKSKKFGYQFDEFTLILLSIDGEKELELEKR